MKLPELTAEERAIHEWQMWEPGVGEEGQRKLKAATVFVSRVGGLGGGGEGEDVEAGAYKGIVIGNVADGGGENFVGVGAGAAGDGCGLREGIGSGG